MISKKFKVGNGDKPFCIVFLLDDIVYYEYHESLESAQKACDKLIPRYCEKEKCVIVKCNGKNNEFKTGEALSK